MPKSVTVMLGGTEYVVPKLNIGQLEELTETGKLSKPFDVLRLAFRRVVPAVDVDQVEADPQEIAAAVKAILQCAGLVERETKNSDSPAPGPGSMSASGETSTAA